MSALTRVNVMIPKSLGEYAELRVKKGDFGNKSEYIRHLIRQDRELSRQNQIEYFNCRIESSIASGLSKKTPEQRRKAVEKTIEKAVASRNK